MSDNHFKLLYDDGNIPRIDLPQDEGSLSPSGDSANQSNVIKAGTYSASTLASFKSVEPLPESFRPRKDGPGGE